MHLTMMAVTECRHKHTSELTYTAVANPDKAICVSAA